jgi:hypothetical protein
VSLSIRCLEYLFMWSLLSGLAASARMFGMLDIPIGATLLLKLPGVHTGRCCVQWQVLLQEPCHTMLMPLPAAVLPTHPPPPLPPPACRAV